jgi:hypothetical protein
VDQLHEATADGHLSENARMNCVPTSVAAAMSWLLDRHFDGDQLKHAVYGEHYLGLTSPNRYVTFARSQGVLLRRITADSQRGLVDRLKDLLNRGVPTLVTMPAAWQKAPADPLHPQATTHVSVAVGLGPQGQIRVMNPWGGFWQEGDDDYWAARLCYGELWTLERLDQAGASPQIVAAPALTGASRAGAAGAAPAAKSAAH